AGQIQALQEQNAALQAQVADVQKRSEATLAAIEALAAKIPDPSAPAPTTAGVEAVEPAHETPTVAATPESRSPPPNTVLRPGWVVEFMPMTYDATQRGERWVKGRVSAGSFVAQPSGFGLLEHRRVTKAKNHVGFRASGYFVARESGDYTFDLTLAQGKQAKDWRGLWVGCDLALSINDKSVIAGPVQIKVESEMSAQGVVALSPGQYRAVLDAACPRFDYSRGDDDNLASLESDMEKLQLRIAVRAPGRPNPVPLDEPDLVHDAVVRQ
ncbi:MAG TPA: hypothetical protein VM555_07125, partial [Tahibacter sp.]|nr:hypothetical protein [Tahibacter sp.]